MSKKAIQKVNYRTAESVSPGHPDKICDQISDAILDAYLVVDKNARVAVETCGGHGVVFLTGEITAKKHIDVTPIVKRLAGDVQIIKHIATQSGEIARGVDTGGAGDQGIMVGYACSDTPELLPLETVLARKLNYALYNTWPFDGKTQITLRNNAIESIVASFQNAPGTQLKIAVEKWLADEPLTAGNKDVAIHVNPAGDWAQGGFESDAGLTGRKLVIDNYGPGVPIGGGCFSGKDATKVDRSGAYMARRIAVDYLRTHAAKEVYCYLAYAIGRTEPLEAVVIIDGVQQPVEGYDLSPSGIIDTLGLRTPQFEQTARYGHFGHGFVWDK
ncbi:methionine adenosyltransferase [Candidatus Saccharibacteria bacterium]|nr:methionine adenosyltransferase [Candidatus Saccharibacteria bacterium]